MMCNKLLTEAEFGKKVSDRKGLAYESTVAANLSRDGNALNCFRMVSKCMSPC